MRSTRLRRRGPVIGVAALASLALAAGIAYATIPGADKVFTGCMLNKVGTIRLIDKSLPASNLMSHCTSLETPISWNQQGQPGAPGPSGSVGPSGPSGPAGPPGPGGKDGVDGKNGLDGKDGVSVTTASEPPGTNCAGGGVQLTAASGVRYVCNGGRGPQGDRGPQGEPGTQGPKGDQGATGPQGPPGVNGAGLSSLADLNGLPCTLPPTSTPGVVRVTVGPDPGGAISLKCDSGVAFTRLDLEVEAQCSGAFGSCSGDQASITVGSQTCSVTATSSGFVASNGCSFSYPTGTVLQLTGSTNGTPIWGGACAGVTGNVCSVTLTGNNVGVSLRY